MHNFQNLSNIINVVAPQLNVEKLTCRNGPGGWRNITLEDLEREFGQMPEFEDDILELYLEKSQSYEARQLEIADLFLQARVASATNSECKTLAQRLYALYATQDCSETVWNLATCKQPLLESNRIKHADTSSKFQTNINFSDKLILSSSHVLRSIEMLLMRPPSKSRRQVAQACHLWCQSGGKGFEKWYMETIQSIKCENRDSFSIFINTLRHYLSLSKRLVVLHHVATICKGSLEACCRQTVNSVQQL
ncbi:uncharacterized protein BdWA1_003975 [Babesia duncani]|nr:hypothetical protein BdWA1_003975 [Babesia duncani]